MGGGGERETEKKKSKKIKKITMVTVAEEKKDCQSCFLIIAHVLFCFCLFFLDF